LIQIDDVTAIALSLVDDTALVFACISFARPPSLFVALVVFDQSPIVVEAVGPALSRSRRAGQCGLAIGSEMRLDQGHTPWGQLLIQIDDVTAIALSHEFNTALVFACMSFASPPSQFVVPFNILDPFPIVVEAVIPVLSRSRRAGQCQVAIEKRLDQGHTPWDNWRLLFQFDDFTAIVLSFDNNTTLVFASFSFAIPPIQFVAPAVLDQSIIVVEAVGPGLSRSRRAGQPGASNASDRRLDQGHTPWV